MKKFRKLIPALALLLVSAVLMSTASYAWFSMNSKVTVTGMEVKTQVSDNLMIAESALATTGKEADTAFKYGLVTNHTESLLEPVSTINGVNYFYTSTKNVTASGDAASESYVAYVPGDDFDGNYGLNSNNEDNPDAFGFKDYVFQLKAVNTSNASKHVYFNQIALTYGGTATSQKAFRVAIFVWDMGEDGNTAAGNNVAADKLVTILAPDDAANFTSGKAVNSTSTLDSVVNPGAAAKVGTVAANKTNFYKVVVRLWLEGEDNTCNNTTFADLTSAWALDLQITFDATDGGISVLGNTNQAKVGLVIGTDNGVNNSSTNKVINGVTYYAITGKTLGANQLYLKSDAATLAQNSTVYAIASGDQVYDVTNQVSISDS